MKSCRHVTCSHIILVYFCLLFLNLISLFFYGSSFDLIICTTIFCVGAGKSTLRSLYRGLDHYIFHRKMEKARFMRDEMDGNLFISR